MALCIVANTKQMAFSIERRKERNRQTEIKGLKERVSESPCHKINLLGNEELNMIFYLDYVHFKTKLLLISSTNRISVD